MAALQSHTDPCSLQGGVLTYALTLTMGKGLEELGTAPVGRLLLKYSLPAVVGTVVSAVYNIVDSIVIGHAIDDPNVVAGIAVTFPVMNITTALGMLKIGRASCRDRVSSPV